VLYVKDRQKLPPLSQSRSFHSTFVSRDHLFVVFGKFSDSLSGNYLKADVIDLSIPEGASFFEVDIQVNGDNLQKEINLE
jgi:hypothetical protein